MRIRLTGWIPILGALLLAVVSVAVFSGAGGITTNNPERLTLDVAPDLSTFDAVRTTAPGDQTPTGPFYIQGPIFPAGTLRPDGTPPEGATSIGTFRSWGWLFNGATGAAVVSQAFEIDGHGEVQVQGLEDGRRTVVGGNGRLVNVRGEGFVHVINPENLSFRIAFQLRGAGR